MSFHVHNPVGYTNSIANDSRILTIDLYLLWKKVHVFPIVFKRVRCNDSNRHGNEIHHVDVSEKQILSDQIQEPWYAVDFYPIFDLEVLLGK